MVSPEDLLIFRKRGAEKGKEKPAEAEQSKPQPQPAPQQQAAAAPPAAPEKTVEQAHEEAPAKPAQARVTTAPEGAMPRGVATKKQALNRQSAKGMYCSWHPWRSAFAICGYCHRPFCYEDIEEFNGGYYCLEDIDKVSSTHIERVYTSYTNIGLVSAAMLMAVFALFVFFANAQVRYVVSYAMSVGVSAFVMKLNYSYGSVILEAAMAVISLAAAILVVLQSRRSFLVGVLTGIGNVALFSYQYLNGGTYYMAAIAVISLAALITLSYSRAMYVSSVETPFVETRSYG